jgi:Ca-activated chloride channel family protein
MKKQAPSRNVAFRATLAAAVSVFAMILAVVAPRRAAAAPIRQQESGQIKIEVNLVTIPVSVVDRANRPIVDLPRDAFEIYDDGKAQTIRLFEAESHQSIDIALMIDSSMSTALDFPAQRDACLRFIRKVVRPGDGFAFFTFSDEVTQRTEFTDNVPLIQQAIQKVKEGAGTALYDAVVLGSRELEKRKSERRKVIVLVTDGGETTSKASFESARSEAIRSDALLYSVILRPVKNESGRNTAGEHAIETITETTGGAMFFPDSNEQLDEIFARIDRELRTQYRIGFYPEPKPPAGQLRHLKVVIKGGDYTPRYRQAYIAPGAAH